MDNKLKVETIVRITRPDGSVIEASGESRPEIPTPEDFDLETMDGFLRDFDSLERGIITARKEAEEKLAAEFLADASKKPRSRQDPHPSNQK